MAISEAGNTAIGTAAMAGFEAAYKGVHLALPKAQLYVPKTYSLNAMGSMTAAIGKNDSAILSALSKKKRSNSRAATATDGFFKRGVKQALGSMPVVSLAMAANLKGAATMEGLSEKNYSVMEVQYNPKSIQISSNGGGMLRPPAAGDASAYQMQITSNVMRTNFSVELVFEDINIADAFHLEGLSMNAEELAQTALSTAVNTIGDGFSIQKQCEGILSLLNFKRLKQVIFMWSDMFFHGELTSVRVNYEMFNKLGNPVLAKVQLEIQQNDSSGGIRYVSDDDQWNTAFDIAFGDATLGAAATKMGGFGA